MVYMDNTELATILYVDDEPMTLKYFDRLLSPHYRVLTALSATEGIAIMEREGDDITVLITDQRMPGGNGNELLRYARENYPKILRILTTAYSELDDAILAINAGEIYRYITKPWNLDMLRTEVRLAVEVATLRGARDDLLQAKVQVQHTHLLANRINNLVLACGMNAATCAALTQYASCIKQLGGISLSVDWYALYYSDWMQREAMRHTEVAHHIQHWLQQWSDPSTEALMQALGDAALQAPAFTALWTSCNSELSSKDCALLAWFIAVHRAGKHSITMTMGKNERIQLELTAKPPADEAPTTLATDWLAHCVEDLAGHTRKLV